MVYKNYELGKDDWTPEITITDHLGTGRIKYRYKNNAFQFISATNLDPFGASLSENKDRKGFIGCNQDNESELGVHGVRQYEKGTGRFLAVEPLIDKYHKVSGYQYSLNNPVSLVDENGKEVQATTPEAQKAILDMLPSEAKSYVSFDEKGNINKELINKSTSESSNFNNLKEIVNNQNLFIVSTSSNFQYLDKDGNVNVMELGKIRVDPTWESGPYSLSTKEIGFQGETLVPGRSDEINSPNKNTYIIINSLLSRRGKAETMSHELLGHGLFSIQGKNHSHIFGPSSTDENQALKKQIIDSKNETIKNME